MESTAKRMNLRELLKANRRSTAWLNAVMGVSDQVGRVGMLYHGRMSVQEAEILASALGLSHKVVMDALDETRVRPGERDARGRKKKIVPGGATHGTSIDVGLGRSGHSSVASDVRVARRDSGRFGEAVQTADVAASD